MKIVIGVSGASGSIYAIRLMEKLRARPEAEPRVPARQLGVHVLLIDDRARQPIVVGDDAPAVVREQREDRVAIVEAEEATIHVVLDREIEHRQRAPEGLEVNVLVIDENTVEIEQDGKRHRGISFDCTAARCTSHAARPRPASALQSSSR